MFDFLSWLERKEKLGVVWVAAENSTKLKRSECLKENLEICCNRFKEFLQNLRSSNQRDIPRNKIRLFSECMALKFGRGAVIILRIKYKHFLDELSKITAKKFPKITVPKDQPVEEETEKQLVIDLRPSRLNYTIRKNAILDINSRDDGFGEIEPVMPHFIYDVDILSDVEFYNPQPATEVLHTADVDAITLEEPPVQPSEDPQELLREQSRDFGDSDFSVLKASLIPALDAEISVGKDLSQATVAAEISKISDISVPTLPEIPVIDMKDDESLMNIEEVKEPTVTETPAAGVPAPSPPPPQPVQSPPAVPPSPAEPPAAPAPVHSPPLPPVEPPTAPAPIESPPTFSLSPAESPPRTTRRRRIRALQIDPVTILDNETMINQMATSVPMPNLRQMWNEHINKLKLVTAEDLLRIPGRRELTISSSAKELWAIRMTRYFEEPDDVDEYLPPIEILREPHSEVTAELPSRIISAEDSPLVPPPDEILVQPEDASVLPTIIKESTLQPPEELLLPEEPIVLPEETAAPPEEPVAQPIPEVPVEKSPPPVPDRNGNGKPPIPPTGPPPAAIIDEGQIIIDYVRYRVFREIDMIRRICSCYDKLGEGETITFDILAPPRGPTNKLGAAVVLKHLLEFAKRIWLCLNQEEEFGTIFVPFEDNDNQLIKYVLKEMTPASSISSSASSMVLE